MRIPPGARLFAAPVLGALFVTSPAFALSPRPADGAPPEAPSDRRCAVVRHEGVSDDDAAGVEEVVCGLVRASGRPGRYDVRVTKLGAKVVLTLGRSVAGSAADEKQIVLSGLDEVSVAAPRLLEASDEQKPVAETVDVTNVVGEETRTPKKRHASVHGWFGVIGAAAAGRTGGGVNLGLSAGSARWSFVGDLRFAGEAFNEPAALVGTVATLGSMKIDSEAELSFVSLAAGARHHLLTTDISPFVGMGLGLDYLSLGAERRVPAYPYTDKPSGKMGVAGYAELGLDVLRTRAFGGVIALRADMPAFAVDETKPDPADTSRQFRRSTITPVFGAGVALRF